MSRRKRMPSERLWGSTENGEIEFESLTLETLEGALEVIRESFFTNESVCKGVELLEEPGASKELEELCILAARDGVSIVAVEVATGKVVSVAFNKIQSIPEENELGSFEAFSKKSKFASSRALVDFMIDVDSRVDLFEYHNVRHVFEIMFLATLTTHSRRRIGELVTRASMELAKELRNGNRVKTPVEIDDETTIANEDVVPELVSMICTSNYSYNIAKKLGFYALCTVNFDQYEFNGKKFSERIGDQHRSTSLVAKRIESSFRNAKSNVQNPLARSR